jgi:hypothetical protein
MELEFGWQQDTFYLSDIELRTHIVKIKDDCSENDTISFLKEECSKTNADKKKGFDHYKNQIQTMYSRPSRTLSAKGSFGNNEMFLGVPEDKKPNYDAPIKHVDIHILEVSEDSINAYREEFKFWSKPEDNTSYLEAAFNLPTHVFDEIDRLISIAGVELEVTIEREGWYWIAPDGEIHYYFSTKDREKAKLQSIRIKRKQIT